VKTSPCPKVWVKFFAFSIVIVESFLKTRPVLIADSGFPYGRNPQIKCFSQPTKNEKF